MTSRLCDLELHNCNERQIEVLERIISSATQHSDSQLGLIAWGPIKIPLPSRVQMTTTDHSYSIEDNKPFLQYKLSILYLRQRW